MRIMPLRPERDPVLLVHANYVLPRPVPNQRIEANAGNAQRYTDTVFPTTLPTTGTTRAAGTRPGDRGVSAGVEESVLDESPTARDCGRSFRIV